MSVTVRNRFHLIHLVRSVRRWWAPYSLLILYILPSLNALCYLNACAFHKTSFPLVFYNIASILVVNVFSLTQNVIAYRWSTLSCILTRDTTLKQLSTPQAIWLYKGSQATEARSDRLPDIPHQPSGLDTPLPNPSAWPRKTSLITFRTYLVSFHFSWPC
jgi:hypothetical protein